MTYPVVIIEDRYGGGYSGGKWLAIDAAEAMENGSYRIIRIIEGGPHGSDTEAMMFWKAPPDWITVGDFPNDALAALAAKAKESAA